MIQFETLKRCAAVALVFAITPSAFAKVTFEGYYKAERSGKQTGFLVVREEFEPSQKVWTISYLMETLRKDGRIFQSRTVLKQDEKFNPISSEHEEWGNGARFKFTMSDFGDKSFKSHTVSGGITRDRVEEFKKGQFFISALNHKLPFKTMRVGQSYPYLALRDDGNPVKYSVKVIGQKLVAGKKAFQLVDENPWRREEYWMTENGEVLSNRLPAKNMTLTLVPTLDSAVGMMNYDQSALAQFFGTAPRGDLNVVAQAESRSVVSNRSPASLGAKPVLYNGGNR